MQDKHANVKSNCAEILFASPFGIDSKREEYDARTDLLCLVS